MSKGDTAIERSTHDSKTRALRAYSYLIASRNKSLEE
jgi:hypothetical protein